MTVIWMKSPDDLNNAVHTSRRTRIPPNHPAPDVVELTGKAAHGRLRTVGKCSMGVSTEVRVAIAAPPASDVMGRYRLLCVQCERFATQGQPLGKYITVPEDLYR